MEKCVLQNVFHPKHMVYRSYPSLAEMATVEAKWLEVAKTNEKALKQKVDADNKR